MIWRNLPSRIHFILYGCHIDDIDKQIARHPDLMEINARLDEWYVLPDEPRKTYYP